MRADQEDEARDRTSGGAWYRPMVARTTDEGHRSATVLELFFDLCFVVAVAQAASALHHEVAEDHVGDGVVGYATVFFAIWWAWMNFTWFASAYDTDDVAYRVTTLVQIAGALILAAGVPDAMDGGDFAVITVGYVVMRLAMVTQWLRAAGTDPRAPARRAALRRRHRRPPARLGAEPGSSPRARPTPASFSWSRPSWPSPSGPSGPPPPAGTRATSPSATACSP